MLLLGTVADSGIGIHTMQQTAEVHQSRLASFRSRLDFDQVGASHNVLQTGESHLGQIFAHFLSQEFKIVHQILVVSAEAFTQFRVLGGHTHRAGVGMAFAHHDATQHNQYRGSEGKFFGTQQRHADDVASGLDLTVGLKAHLAAQSVQNEGLLGFAQTDFRRNSGIAHG